MSHQSVEVTVDARALTPEMAEGNSTLEQALQWSQETGSRKCRLRLYYGDSRPGGAMQLFDMVRGYFHAGKL